ncbi:branched-chain amino acid ABC transporter permease [Rhodococcus sp. BP-349]|uniref:branched-chain amino acid ABC transporter permease n=1 Tax=unclassified Rhodococcus (in: high G+C Gram-positive bacteria) TaxID=192944 RepID=UPI001C9B0EEC|nr:MULTISPECIES: branched-chain amino acid ABC transporter permease [unclassified Rhodococcus (in: high G+C Gram-positive bacteria)]MBY6539046.1 branched-chain amino acid ABC transporter permease [Rhodococcus sp. BP-363]MBY6543383.1 branched-chain amino acid ABC transporter permease [Rhodococcus sp. BP-369]MBY6562613.1 branched-chain amino acid ABC transporter permease [Rhodococcus sp. BP-370]MBY6576905.1 branched-chain amino acid ABC transporter permease [Rhodococcus sp. BP-364]MBY6586206.1 b
MATAALVRALVVVLLGLIAAATFGGTALAQEPTPSPTPSSSSPPASGSESDSAPPADAVNVSGSLNNAGERLVGVDVVALDSGESEVARTTSETGGRWTLPVSPGNYTFRVDPETLPDGVSVQGDVDRTVEAGRANTVIFSFGEERSATVVPFYEQFLRTTIDGLRFGLVIALAAIGLSLIFGTTGLTNFAHGELVTLGAVAAWVFNQKLGIQLIPATVLAVIVGVAVGWANNAGLWRPLRRRKTGLIGQLVVSIGLAIALRYLILIFFSDRAEPYKDYQAQVQREWGPFAITDVNLACIVISVVVLVLVALMLQKTRIGKAMRAVADNRDLAASSGINVERVVTFVWCMGGGLAALGGVLFGLSELGGRVQWEMGFKLLLLMFAGITLGGLGTAYGALLGCVIVGLLVQWSTLVINPDLKYIGGLLVLIVILIVRPQGILGSRQRIG